MYYEEKIINGVLMFRTKPDSGAWQQCSIEKMGQRIVELEKNAALLRYTINEQMIQILELRTEL